VRKLLAPLVALLAACAAHGPSSPAQVIRGEGEAEVLFDLAATCPKLSVDRGAQQFLAAATEHPEELGVTSTTRSPLVLGRRASRGASLEWHRDLGPGVTSFALADGRLGEGVAIAGAAASAVPFVDASGGSGLFVLSFAPDGARRFGRWVGGDGSVEKPRVTALVLGPRSEVSLAGTAREVLDFGGIALRPERGDYDDTFVFVVQYTATGTLAFATSLPARLGTSPRLVAARDGRLVVGFDARDGTSTLVAIGEHGVGERLPVALQGSIGALVAQGAHDIVALTQSRDAGGTSTDVRVSRLRGGGSVVWSRIMHGELQEGAAAVTRRGDLWFGGWFEGDPDGCSSAPGAGEREPVVPRLQIIDASGARCRSLAVATRDARWSAAASLVETAEGRMTFVTPLSGESTLPGVRAHASPLANRCVAVSLPTAAPEYTP